MPIKFPQEVFPRLSNRVIAFSRRHAIIHGHINRVVVKKSRRVSFFFLHFDLAPPLSSLFSLSHSLFFFIRSSFSKWSIGGGRGVHGTGDLRILRDPPTEILSDGVCTACTIRCRCVLWGVERLRGVKCTLYKEAAAYVAGIQIWRTALEGHCDKVYEMGLLTGNHLVSLLVYIFVVNEIRLPLVSI